MKQPLESVLIALNQTRLLFLLEHDLSESRPPLFRIGLQQEPRVKKTRQIRKIVFTGSVKW